MNNLTDGWKNKNKKNRDILLFVRDYINIYGTSPTYREVSKHFNSSLGAISNSINILIEDKLLKKYKDTRLLILTLKGKQMLKNYIPAYEEHQALKEKLDALILENNYYRELEPVKEIKALTAELNETKMFLSVTKGNYDETRKAYQELKTKLEKEKKWTAEAVKLDIESQKEVETLKEENERLKSFITEQNKSAQSLVAYQYEQHQKSQWTAEANKLRQENTALKSELAKYKEALEYLSDKRNYAYYGNGLISPLLGNCKFTFEFSSQTLSQEKGESQ